jgi:hypothetical protein
MTDHEREMIEEKHINVVKFENLTYDTEKAIFGVIQNGVSLNSAEKVNALDVPIVIECKKLRDKYYFSCFGDKFSDVRCFDVLFFARIIMLAAGISRHTGTAADVYKYLHNAKKSVASETLDIAEKIICRLAKLCSNISGVLYMFILAIIINKYPMYDNDEILATYQDIIENISHQCKRVSDQWIVLASNMI